MACLMPRWPRRYHVVSMTYEERLSGYCPDGKELLAHPPLVSSLRVNDLVRYAHRVSIAE